VRGGVTLTRLALAWVPVAMWFLIATAGSATLVGLLSRSPGQEALWVGLPFPLLKWRLAEAALLTMFGSLWFNSLGTGEWWLVFLLVGAIATIPTWLTFWPRDARPARASLVGASTDLARYVLAGAILAWRLG
jgi:hypothetical protein